MLTTILWDMDGVLVETSETHYRSWVVAFQHYNLNFERSDFLQFYGMNDESTVRGILGECANAQIIREISEYKEDWFRKSIRDEIQLLPGVSHWLDYFSTRKYKQAVASSGPYENIELIVNATGISFHFNELVSCANQASKPDPWVFKEAARRLGSIPAECLVIEDTPNGIQAACAAGMRCLAVCTSNSRSALSKADLIVKDLSELDRTVFDEHFL